MIQELLNSFLCGFLFGLPVRMSLRQNKLHKALLMNLIHELCGLKPTADSAVLESGLQAHLSLCRWY